MSTTQPEEDYNLYKNKNALLQKLNGEWRGASDKVTALKDVKNRKNVKYGDELLNNYTHDDGVELNPANYRSGDFDLATTSLDADYLKTVHQLKKITEADAVKVLSGEDLPIIFVFFTDGGDGDPVYRGAFMVAPRISEDEEMGR